MKFEAANPSQIVVGGGRYAPNPEERHRKMLPFVALVSGHEAGVVTVEEGDDPKEATKYLRLAAEGAHVKIRSRWIEPGRKLGWKRVGASARAA